MRVQAQRTSTWRRAGLAANTLMRVVYLDHVLAKHFSKDTSVSERPTEELIRFWSDIRRAKTPEVNVKNIVVLSGSVYSGAELILEAFSSFVSVHSTAPIFRAVCEDHGEWPLGVVERLIGMIAEELREDPSFLELFARHADSLGVFWPDLVPAHLHRRHADFFSTLNATADQTLENTAYMDGFLDETSCLVREALIVSAKKHKAPSVLLMSHCQTMDPVSQRVLSRLLRSVCGDPILLCIQVDWQTANQELCKLLRSLYRNGRAAHLMARESSGVVSLTRSNRRLGATGYPDGTSDTAKSIQGSPLLERDLQTFAALSGNEKCLADSAQISEHLTAAPPDADTALDWQRHHQSVIRAILAHLCPGARLRLGLLAHSNRGLSLEGLESAAERYSGRKHAFPTSAQLKTIAACGSDSQFTLQPLWRIVTRQAFAEEAKRFHQVLSASVLSCPTARRGAIPGWAVYPLMEAGEWGALANSLYETGFHAYEIFGEREASIRFYEACRERCLLPPEDHSRLLGKLAGLHAARGSIQKALELYDLALADRPSPFLEVLLVCRYAVLLCKSPAQFERARQLLAASMLRVSQVQDPVEFQYAQARLNAAEAFVEYRTGGFSRALALMGQAGALLQSLRGRSQGASYELRIHKNIARILRRSEPGSPVILSSYLRCLQLCEEELAQDRTQILLLIGDMYVRRGLPEQAERYFSRVLSARGDPVRPAMPTLCRYISRSYSDKAYTHHARLWTDRLIDYYLSCNRAYDAVATMQERARQLYETGHYEHSLRDFEASVALIAKRPELPEAPALLLKAQTYCSAIGDREAALRQAKEKG